MGPRAGFSTLLVLGSLVLLLAISVGNGMGGRVLRQISGHGSTESTIGPIATPSPDADAPQTALRMHRRSVLSVATDPAFPDPRITPEPTPSPTARPRPTQTPALPPVPSDEPTIDTSGGDETKAPYTSPPLAFPLVKHSPGETSPPDDLSPSPAASP